MAGVGRSHNELAVLQLQRQHEREEDKARLRVQQGLLSGPDSERQRCFFASEQAQFRPEAGDACRQFPGASRSRGLRAPVLSSLLQRHDSPVSIYIPILPLSPCAPLILFSILFLLPPPSFFSSNFYVRLSMHLLSANLPPGCAGSVCTVFARQTVIFFEHFFDL